MTNEQPRVSFVPKTSLVREETFLERPRPRSLLSFLAVVALIGSVGSYGALYAFNVSLQNQIADQVNQVNKAQNSFINNSDVARARDFQSRAVRAQSFLDNHVVASPVFRFLKESTLASIYYTSIAYKAADNDFQVILTGEAPSYTSLAAQSAFLTTRRDVLTRFAIGDIGLTKYGTVAFSLKLQFVPQYLSYIHDRATRLTTDITTPAASSTTPVAPKATTTVATSTPAKTGAPLSVASDVVAAAPTTDVSVGVPTFTETSSSSVPGVSQAPDTSGGVEGVGSSAPAPEKTFWSYFKFW